jgi:hypothetical protein
MLLFIISASGVVHKAPDRVVGCRCPLTVQLILLCAVGVGPEVVLN